MSKEHLSRILEERNVSGLFQTVIDLQDGKIHGYEGLIRGPSDSPLHSPLQLFKCAREHGLTLETERMCRNTLHTEFSALGLRGKLFINVSPHLISGSTDERQLVLASLAKTGMEPSSIVIELTETSPSIDYVQLRTALAVYKEMGFEIAIDDLGEGFSSMRLWSEIRPNYVKIDMHFIQGINLDPLKQQFVRSIRDIAEEAGAAVIAEGIETQSELAFVTRAGIQYGQGYFIARPIAKPLAHLSIEVTECLLQSRTNKLVTIGRGRMAAFAEKLCREVPFIPPTVTCNEVFDRFVSAGESDVIPVVHNGLPLGLITRSAVVESFAKQFQRELHGKKPCTFLMHKNALVIDKNTTIQDLSQIVASGDKRHLIDGFIITHEGKYQGMGTGQDLIREITQLQIDAAKLANPLTQLPGNVLINERIDYFLSMKVSFHACYADLDFFKPFNDVYGYQKGDDIIQLCGEILTDCADEGDFVGHIGGDDFVVLLTGENYEKQCQDIVNQFEKNVVKHFNEEHAKAGGYHSEDRLGKDVFHSLISLSLGVVKIQPEKFTSHQQVSVALTDAKKQAKKIVGNSYFIDPRQT